MFLTTVLLPLHTPPQVLKGFGVVRELGSVAVNDLGEPLAPCVIADCGALPQGTDPDAAAGPPFSDGGWPCWPEDLSPGTAAPSSAKSTATTATASRGNASEEASAEPATAGSSGCAPAPASAATAAAATGPLPGESEAGMRLRAAGELRQQGNALYRSGCFDAAAAKYEQARRYVAWVSLERLDRVSYDDKSSLLVEEVVCTVNRATALLRGGRPGDAVAECGVAIRAAQLCVGVPAAEEQFAKAHLRAGQAYAALPNFERALEYLVRAAELRPHDEGVVKELRRVRRLQAEHAQREKERFAQRFASVL